MWWLTGMIAHAQSGDELTPPAQEVVEQLVVEHTQGGVGSSQLMVQIGLSDRWTLSGLLPALGYRIGKRGSTQLLIEAGVLTHEWGWNVRGDLASRLGSLVSLHMPLDERVGLWASAELAFAHSVRGTQR